MKKDRQQIDISNIVRVANILYKGSRSTTSEESVAIDRTFKKQMKNKSTRPNRL